MSAAVLVEPGERFGMLVVLGEAEKPPGNKQKHYLVRCDCGREVVMPSYPLRKVAQSCGCKRPGRKPLQVSVGDQFGLLTAVRAAPSRLMHSYWWFQCVCGKEVEAQVTRVKSGAQKSCGCWRYTIGRWDTSVFCAYSTAHVRIKSLRGRASDHACITCGEPAKDWAYQHDAAVEFSGWVDSQGGRYFLRWSGDPNDYAPMCRACHRTLDQSEAAS